MTGGEEVAWLVSGGAGDGGTGEGVRIRLRASTISWNGSGELMLLIPLWVRSSVTEGDSDRGLAGKQVSLLTATGADCKCR